MGLKYSRLLSINLLNTFFESRDEEMITEEDCYNDDGAFDDDKFDENVEKEDVRVKKKKKVLLSFLNLIERKMKAKMETLKQQKVIPIKKARKAHPKFFIDPMTQKRRPMSPKLSFWWLKYVQHPQPDNSQWSKSFRMRFRMPYTSYLVLLDMICDGDLCRGLFDRWRTPDDRYFNRGNNKKVSPLELLLLGSLRYLGRGWTFDDLEESTFISRDVHRVFFHKFPKFGATILYPRYVSAPQTAHELQECEHEYRIAGFPGCIGSTDATHIPLEKLHMHCAKHILASSPKARCVPII
jgi:hypothetical protein